MEVVVEVVMEVEVREEVVVEVEVREEVGVGLEGASALLPPNGLGVW